jgi:hypothetical protein
MDGEDRLRLEALLTADADADPAASRMQLICARLVTELGVSGAGATVLSHVNGNGSSPRRGLVYATNTTSTGLEDLQLTVGEGPCLEAFKSGGPVLVADLAEQSTRWPGFTPGAVDLGAAAVFSFPLQMGAARLGSIDCYRDTPGPLTAGQISQALMLSDLAALAVIVELDGHRIEDLSWLIDSHTDVNMATGMVQVQLGVPGTEALLRLRGYAYTNTLSLTEVARRVVARTLTLDADS